MIRRGRHKVNVFPYHGEFFRMVEPDMSLPLDEREISSEKVWETECDIQEVSKANNPILIATYSIFMPFEPGEPIPIRRGMSFHSSMNGIDISGEITNVVLSQLGGLVAYVKDYDADEGSR